MTPFYNTIVITLLLTAGRPYGMSYLQKANDIYGQGKLQEAITLYKKAIHAGENPTLCYFNLANACFQLDSLPESIVYYRAAVDEAPDFFRGHLNLAIAYYSLEDIGNCIASITRALELEPDNKKALLIRAASYRKVSAWPEAITAFEQLVAIDRSNGDAYIALGEMYRDLGDFVMARKWLGHYPDNGKNLLYVTTMLAEMFEREGNNNKTLYHLQKARELDQDNQWLVYRICQLHEKMGNHLVAYEEAKNGLVQFPNFGDLALFAGNCAFRQELWVEAHRFYSQARENGCPGAIVGLENVRLARERQFEITGSQDAVE